MKKLLLAVLLAGIATAPVLEAKSAKKSCLRSSRGCRKGVCRRSMVRPAAKRVTRAYSVPVVAAAASSKPARSCANGMCSR